MSDINQVKITGHYRDLAGNIPVGKFVRFRPVNSIGVPGQPIILDTEITKAIIDVNGDLKALDGISDFYLLATNFTGSIPNSTYVEVTEGFGSPEPVYYLLVDFNLSVIDLSTVTRNSFIPISGGGGSSGIIDITGDSHISVTNPSGPHVVLSIDLSAYALLTDLSTHAAIKASSSILGHIKVGAGLAIDSAGILSAINSGTISQINGDSVINITNPNGPTTSLSFVDSFLHSLIASSPFSVDNTDPRNLILTIDLSAYATNSALTTHASLIASSSQLGHIKVGSGLSIDGSGVLSASGGGSVTSVGLSLPSIFSVSGSPVTTSGTLTATLINEAINTIFAGPSSGSSAAPTFRSLVAADLPSTTAFNNIDNNFPLTDFISGSNYIKLNPASPAITLFNAGVAINTMSAGDLSHMEFDHGLQVHGSILGVTTIDIDDLNIEKASAGGPTLQIKYSGVDWFIWQMTSGGMLTFKDTNSHQVMSFGGGFSSSYPEQIGIGRQTTLNAKLHIQGSNDIVTTIIQRFATQTADILDIKDDSNSLLFGIDVNGQIKTANSLSAVTPGVINSKLPIYNASGTLLGYIPIYTTIT